MLGGSAKLLLKQVECCLRKFHGLVRTDNIRLMLSNNGMATGQVAFVALASISKNKGEKKAKKIGTRPQMYQCHERRLILFMLNV